MDLISMNLWRGGIFKQLKYLVSSPQQAQKVFLISETGVVSQEMLGMQTGFVVAPKNKKAWAVIHSLKFQVRVDGLPPQDESVLVISERSYMPLDPLNTIGQKEKEKIASLNDIARLRHAEARATAGTTRDTEGNLSSLIINGCFLLLALYAMLSLFGGCGQ